MPTSWMEARTSYDEVFDSVGGSILKQRDSGFGRRVWEDFWVPSIRDDQPKHWPYDPNPYPVKIVQTFKHLKEKPVEQYEALVPLDFERHLYGGSKLYDTETAQYRTLSTVTKTSRKSGFTTTLLFVGGFKHTLNDTEGLMNVTKRYRWVTLRNVPEKLNTIPHYTDRWGKAADTNITAAGMKVIDEKIEAALREYRSAPVNPKKRWFR